MIKKRTEKLALIGILFCAFTCLKSYCQTNESIDTIAFLPEIEIRIEKSLFNQKSLSTTSLDVKKIIAPNYSLNELTNRINGIFTTSPNNFAQDSRISSRGFGARSAFGIRGIRILTDGFPDTSPDGQSQLDNVDFTGLKTVEFLRGPQSGLYGNNSGGVLMLKSFDFNEKNILGIGHTTGSYGLNISTFNMVQGNQFFKTKLNINHTNYKGYRTWSEFRNTIIQSNSEYRKGAHQIHLLLNYVTSPIGNDPGGVNTAELSAGRNLARPANMTFMAGETVKQMKYGLSYKLMDKEGLDKLKFKFYGVDRAFTNSLPFENSGAVTIDRKLFGGSLEYDLRYKIKSINIGHSIGLESDYQNDLRKQFQNLKTALGSERFNQNEFFHSKSTFLLNEVHFSKKLWLVFNLRYDDILTKAQDNFLSNGDQSGNINTNAFNYTLALNYKDKLHRYNIIRSTGFENPTLSELSNNPSGIGGFSAILQPMLSLNHEINIESVSSKWLSYQLSFYTIKTNNEIVGYEITGQAGRTFFRNQGDTKREGIEASLKIKLHDKVNLSIQQNSLSAKYDKNSAFENKKLAGVPESISQFSIDCTLKNNLFIQLDLRRVGGIALDDANNSFTEKYNEMNLRAKKSFNINKLSLNIAGGINNLLNSSYYSNIRINAAQGRYYEPAMPRNYYTTLSLSI
jgi:iron complex outermembrane recepter protein